MGHPNDKRKEKLTIQQQEFCVQYIIDFNAKEAVLRCGYQTKYPTDIAGELLKMPKVRAEIARLLKERRQEYPVTFERVRDEIARVAFANPFEVIDSLSETGKVTLKTLQDIPNRIKPAVKGVKKTKEGFELLFHDKMAALEMLAKHFGFFEKDNEQKKVNQVSIYLPHNNRDDRMLDYVEDLQIEQPPTVPQLPMINQQVLHPFRKDRYKVVQ